MNTRMITGVLMLGLVSASCDRIPFLGGGGNDPADIARSFWEAARTGDMELAQTFATGSESVSLNQPEGGETRIASVQIGEATVDGDRATVPTTLTNTLASSEPTDLSITTSLVQVDGDWKVDLDLTMDEVMKGIMGVSMTDVAQAMGDAVTGAMQGAMGAATDSSQQAPPAEQSAPATPRQTPPTRAVQQPTRATTVASELPFTPQSGTVSPGMTPEQVVQAWGQPVTERQYGQWMYMFFRNGCENRCGTFDVVFFQNGQVVDAVVRTPAHTYTGVSSSPPGNVAGFTPPSATGGIGGIG